MTQSDLMQLSMKKTHIGTSDISSSDSEALYVNTLHYLTFSVINYGIVVGQYRGLFKGQNV